MPGLLRPSDGSGASCSHLLTGVSLSGAGVREDVFLIWREMEEAGSILAQIQRLVAETPKTSVATTDHGGCC